MRGRTGRELGSVTGEQLPTLELEGQRVEGILPSQKPGPLRARLIHRDIPSRRWDHNKGLLEGDRTEAM